MNGTEIKKIPQGYMHKKTGITNKKIPITLVKL